jgi:hypothetical protein
MKLAWCQAIETDYLVFPRMQKKWSSDTMLRGVKQEFFHVLAAHGMVGNFSTLSGKSRDHDHMVMRHQTFYDEWFFWVCFSPARLRLEDGEILEV